MKLSTRSRYGLRMMYEFAMNYGSEPVIIKDISLSQGISEKYLSKLIIPLKGAKLVYSIRGAHGGYILSKDPSKITVREILEVLEGGLTPVDCSIDSSICSKSSRCPAREVWCMLENSINSLLEGITLADMIQSNTSEIKQSKVEKLIKKTAAAANNRSSTIPAETKKKKSICKDGITTNNKESK